MAIICFCGATICLAESEGFEPSIQFPIYTLSRRAPSTTRTTLRKKDDKGTQSSEYFLNELHLGKLLLQNFVAVTPQPFIN